MVDSNPEQATLCYHPSYNSDDADLILESSDGMLFKVHVLMLKLASGFFRDMLSLPRDPNTSDGSIKMSERAVVLEAILDSIYPNNTNVIAEKLSYEDFREVLFVLVNKYDFDAGEHIARSLFQDHRLPFSSILKFGIAWDFGWKAEGKAASTGTLDKHILCPDAQADLVKISSDAIMQLIAFHESRRHAVKDALALPEWMNTWNERFIGYDHRGVCGPHDMGLLSSGGWVAFKRVIDDELARNPSGSGLRSLRFAPPRVVSLLFETKVNCPDCNRGYAKGINEILDRSRVEEALCLLVDSLQREIKC